VAVGIPGPLDADSGVVFAAPHLKGWVDVPAREMLEERLRCPVAIANDADLAGYAEWVAGAGKGSRHFIFITISTGIGGGLIVDGEPVTGAAGTAGEVGHLPVTPDGPPCGQGHRGCLEGSASGTAIARRAAEIIRAGAVAGSALSRLDPESVDARAVQDAAKSGDALACSLFTDAGRALGRAVGGLINILSPEVIAIGGGVINAGELLFSPLRDGVAEIAFEVPAQRCRIVPAGLGTDAGLVGAVAWAVRNYAAPRD
jgi:glucokinase